MKTKIIALTVVLTLAAVLLAQTDSYRGRIPLIPSGTGGGEPNHLANKTYQNLDHVIDVRDYMDGVSGRPTQAAWEADQAGTDVTAAIQAAIDAAKAVAGGAVVYCPKGIYSVSSLDMTAVVAGKEVWLKGAGWPQSQIVVTGDVGIDLTLSSLCRISDLWIDIGSPYTSRVAILLARHGGGSCNGNVIDHCKFGSDGANFLTAHIYGVGCENTRIEHNRFGNTGEFSTRYKKAGVYLSPTDYNDVDSPTLGEIDTDGQSTLFNRIEDNTFYFATGAGTPYAIQINDSAIEMDIVGNDFGGTMQGCIYLGDVGSVGMAGIRVARNKAECTPVSGQAALVYVDSLGSGRVNGLSIYSNDLSGNTMSPLVAASAAVDLPDFFLGQIRCTSGTTCSLPTMSNATINPQSAELTVSRMLGATWTTTTILSAGEITVTNTKALTATAGDNIEQYGADWTGATGSTPPTGWTAYNGNETFTITGSGQAGNCLAFGHVSENARGLYTTARTTRVGHAYVLTWYIKQGTATDYDVSVASAAGMGGMIWYSGTLIATASWVQHTQTFVASTTTSYVAFRNAAAGSLLLDTVTLTEAPLYVNGPAVFTDAVIHTGNNSASHSYASGTTAWTMTATEAAATLFTVTSAGGAADAVFPAAVPGKQFTAYNNSGAAITFKVTGQAGSAVANGKYAIFTMNATDCVEIYEQP